MSDRQSKFYDATTLTEVNEVPMAKPKKNDDGTMRTTRRPTIADARKNGYLCSVTSILDNTYCTSQSLIDWTKDQILNACIDFPFNGRKDAVDEKSWKELVERYKGMILAKAEEYKNFTADRGKVMHAHVNRWSKDKSYSCDDPASMKAIGLINDWMKQKNIVMIDSEKPLGSRAFGFAGTPDMFCVTSEGHNIIADIKTTTFKSFTKPYDKWLLQLGAYQVLTKALPGTQLVQIVIERDLGDVLFIDHEQRDFDKAFLNLFEVFCVMKNYDPRKAA